MCLIFTLCEDLKIKEHSEEHTGLPLTASEQSRDSEIQPESLCVKRSKFDPGANYFGGVLNLLFSEPTKNLSILKTWSRTVHSFF